MGDYIDRPCTPSADPHDFPPPDQLADEDDELEGCMCGDPTHRHYSASITSEAPDVPIIVADEDLESYLIPEGS